MNIQIGSIVIEDPALVKAVVRLIGTGAHDYRQSSFVLRRFAKQLEVPSLPERLCEAFRLTRKARQMREARRTLRMSLRYLGRHMRLEECALVVC